MDRIKGGAPCRQAPSSVPAKRSTTLLAAPSFDDWDRFRDGIGAIEVFLATAGIDDLFQVVGFHPDAVYADAEADDPANPAARAPPPAAPSRRAAARGPSGQACSSPSTHSLGRS